MEKCSMKLIKIIARFWGHEAGVLVRFYMVILYFVGVPQNYSQKCSTEVLTK